MFKIVNAQFIAPGIKRFVIEAPRIARKQRPGQFAHYPGQRKGRAFRSPSNAPTEKGTVNIVVQSIGKTTNLLNSLETGDSILDIVGPLGKPSEIENFGTVVVMGGGVGTAMAYPTAAAKKKAGNRVITILGGRNKDLVLLENEMRQVSDTVFVTTDDGSYGDKGLVTDRLRQLIENGTRIDQVLAVGPIPMMRAVADMTRKEKIRTMVSLNPIMIDGTGMCGGCRVLVEGKSEFACVDGPEFDAHRVDFAVLVQRNAMYRDAEKRSMEDYKRECEYEKQKAKSEARSEVARSSCQLALERNKCRHRRQVERIPYPTKNVSRCRGSKCPSRLPQDHPQSNSLRSISDICGTGASGSAALPGMRQTDLYGLPGGREGQGFRATDRGRRLLGRRREDSRR